MTPINLTECRFGRLTVLYFSGDIKPNGAVWHCRCDCGNEVDIASGHLRGGYTKSCGCIRRLRASKLGSQSSKPEQAEEIIRLRKLGFTYKALGKLMKLTGSRCQRIVQHYAPRLTRKRT